MVLLDYLGSSQSKLVQNLQLLQIEKQLFKCADFRYLTLVICGFRIFYQLLYIKCMTKMENFCWIQESGTYSEDLVLTEYKNTHFVKIGGKFVGDESFSRGTSRIY
jgi:hypothetical protein